MSAAMSNTTVASPRVVNKGGTAYTTTRLRPPGLATATYAFLSAEAEAEAETSDATAEAPAVSGMTKTRLSEDAFVFSEDAFVVPLASEEHRAS